MKIDVAKVAKLANLPLTPGEEKKYSKQLSKILDYAGQLDEINTSKVDPTYNVSPNSNVMRPDEVGESLSQEDATANAANVKDGFIITKRVFEKST
ncbi:Asp-tRNA(Asn)/Glu-tRNA(Gln) amidotransferase subunit GatC [Candidatus Microgenomates bacterium]|nr:Asp-tRNA(Asn)/Glu-tRNA(Gln) amidotransferase subunit GatC [Candidatus Microgenomates bacterium]